MKVCTFRDHCHKKQHKGGKMFKRFGHRHGCRHRKGMRDWQVHFGQCENHVHRGEWKKFKMDGHHKHHGCQHSKDVGKHCFRHEHPRKNVFERCDDTNQFCHHGSRPNHHGFHNRGGHHHRRAEGFDCSNQRPCRCSQANPEDEQIPGPSTCQLSRPKSV